MSCWPTFSRSSRTRSRVSSARSISPCRGTSTRSKTTCPSTSMPWKRGRWATGCCATCCAVCTPTPHREWRRGALPPGQLGKRKACEIRDEAKQLAAAALRLRQDDPDAHDVDIGLDGGRRLTGTVAEVFGDRTVSVTYSKLNCKHLLQAWIPLVALAAHQPDRPWRASCIGRDRRANRILHRVLVPPPDPVGVLRDLVLLYDNGRREPLPLPLRTSHAWADARACGNDPFDAALRRWKSTNYYKGEAEAEAHKYVWPHRRLEDILGTPRPGEETDGENTRLGALAARLWLPLIRAEREPD